MVADRLRKHEWSVRPCALADARRLIETYHYARGCSKTAVYTFGLYQTSSATLLGVTQWLPPTEPACKSVNRYQWKKVLSLSRMVIVPGVPKNAGSFLISQSIRHIKENKQWVTLVTYADESQGHTGGVYRASNWTYVGKTKPTPRWVDIWGRQVAIKATKSRTKQQMLDLGYIFDGKHCKHKFVMHLPGSVALLPVGDLFL